MPCALMPSALMPCALHSTGLAHADHLRPARPTLLRLAVERAIDDELRHLLNRNLEIVRRDAVALEVGRRVEKIDRVRHAVLYGELDRVHLVAERGVQRLRVANDARAELR